MNEMKPDGGYDISGGMRAPENVLPKKAWVFVADPLKAGICLASWAFLMAVAVELAVMDRNWSALVFFIISLGFLYVLSIYGALVHVEAEGLRKSFFGLWKAKLRSEEIGEMGVAGTRIFHRGNPNRAGTIYIYFSDAPMTDEERFGMMLKWPPRNRIFLRFSHKRFAALQVWREDPAVKYNIGKLVL